MNKEFLYQKLPHKFKPIAKAIYNYFLHREYVKYGRPSIKAESSKAKARRERENFFNLYCQGLGLDIGYGGDPIITGVDFWDFEHGDAQYLKGVSDEKYDFVYSSHTIEHMVNPQTAIKNWFRVVKPGGYLIIYLPHRELYEKKKTLPSRFNPDHKFFFLIDKDEAPDTIGIIPLLERSLTGYKIIYVKECSENHTIKDPELHSDGEYSIEAIIRKVK
jgi:SAM-dependent methyltransferase